MCFQAPASGDHIGRRSEFDLSEEALGSPMDCVEDPSFTKAMVDPELNAEFSLCGDLSRRASVFKATACEC